MIGTLSSVAIVCGLLIVSAFQITKPVIAKNKAEYLQKSVFEVLPGSARTEELVLEDGDRVHAGYAESGDLVGVAIPAQGQGFQDLIKVLYGYSPASERIVGLKVLESKETPGLGDKIEKDPAFLKNFEALDVSLAPEGRLSNAIVAVKSGQKTRSWEVDGITGATISSKAIARLLNESASSELVQVRRALP
jgi:electron transport complex protein RnfG